MRVLYLVLPWLPSVWGQLKELPGMPPGLPSKPPAYMVNNEGNTFGAAPDKGVLNGPVTSVFNDLNTTIGNLTNNLENVLKRRASGYWLAELGGQGQVKLIFPTIRTKVLILPDAIRTFRLQVLP